MIESWNIFCVIYIHWQVTIKIIQNVSKRNMRKFYSLKWICGRICIRLFNRFIKYVYRLCGWGEGNRNRDTIPIKIWLVLNVSGMHFVFRFRFLAFYLRWLIFLFFITKKRSFTLGTPLSGRCCHVGFVSFLPMVLVLCSLCACLSIDIKQSKRV